MPWTCPCVGQPEPQPRRPKLDRSMIGQPTNFQHTGHIGSASLHSGNAMTLPTAQSQMSSKGGHIDNGGAHVSNSLISSAVPIVKEGNEIGTVSQNETPSND
mmetsp:Transcript_68691/g.95510  ORF Transcript_68691/g.95510 Transcript_68691/m.95510 type:complete len:102 (+) Transcript_68691:133-438(+)